MTDFDKSYYRNNYSYSEFLEKQDINSFIKYVDFVKKYLKKEGKFLDVGCGTGLVLEQFRTYNVKAVGVEVSKTSIKKCKEKKLNCSYYDGERIPFKDGFFDVVGSFNVLEHTQNPNYFLDEQNRVLKNNGYLIISCPNFLSITNSYHWHTSGFLNKFKNLLQILKKLLPIHSHFEKMKVVRRSDFHADDDACNVTNPMDIIDWAKSRKLKLIYWSSQTQYVRGINNIIDYGIFRYFLGASFLVFAKS
jgi:SAM-dependent methyltransferase